MGRDISVLGTHNLDTSNVNVLAEQLSERLKINVQAMYYTNESHSKLLGIQDVGIIKLECYIANSDPVIYQLVDETYQMKQLYEKFGENVFKNPEYWCWTEGKPDEKRIQDELKIINSPEYLLETPEDSTDDYEFMYIYKFVYENALSYYSRWWDLCRAFIDSEGYRGDFFSDYRRKNAKHDVLLGGNGVFYLDDQSEVLQGVGQGCEADYTWLELRQFVPHVCKDLLLDIPRFINDTPYRNGFGSDYPLAFFDDYSDVDLELV